MTYGKIISQIAHLVNEMTDTIVNSGYLLSPPSDDYFNYVKW